MRAWLVATVLIGCGRVGFDTGDGGMSGNGDGDTLVDPDARRPGGISVGNVHTCAVLGDQLWCWGANDNGQLGTGMLSAPVTRPGRVPGPWRQVAVGERHTCALDLAGDVWCWGGNGFGQLGVGDTSPRLLPTRVSISAPVLQLTSKQNHACVVTDGEQIYCWGRNAEGEIGIDDPFSPTSMRAAPTLPTMSTNAGPIVAGHAHTLWIRADGALYGAGRNTADELGLGTGQTMAQYRAFALLDAGPWARMSGGQNSSCGIRGDMSLWCWGANDNSNLGLGDTTNRPTPARVDMRAWIDVDTDTFHTCGLIAPGQLACWGRSLEGQLGLEQDAALMTPMITAAGTDWVDVDTGRFDTCAQRSDGAVWCTGRNDALGTNPVKAWTPVPVPLE